MKAYYHSIEEFGTVDGQGIRFVLFLTGCSLGCTFCHNPDTWTIGDKQISVQQVLDRYSRYQEFYKASGGGITVSGGEPLQQAEFVATLFKACHEQGIHTTLDTSGYASSSALAQVVAHTDEVLFCLKAACDGKYGLLTNASIQDILPNLKYVATHTACTVRYVVIPGVNDNTEDICALKDILSRLHTAKLELLPYHNLGMSKWEQLGWEYNLKNVRPATPEDLDRVRQRLQ